MLLSLENKSTGPQSCPVSDLSGGFQHQASSLPYIPGLVSVREEGGSFGRLCEEELLLGEGEGCLPDPLTSLSMGREAPSSDLNNLGRSRPSGLSWVGACQWAGSLGQRAA